MCETRREQRKDIIYVANYPPKRHIEHNEIEARCKFYHPEKYCSEHDALKLLADNVRKIVVTTVTTKMFAKYVILTLCANMKILNPYVINVKKELMKIFNYQLRQFK